MNEDRDLRIRPIENGTVIDHITTGEALNVLRIIGITGTTRETISVATNVPSGLMKKKDVVKIDNRELRREEVDRIAIIAPKATINIIRNYKVVDKKGVQIPEVITGVVKCPNPRCISNANEPIESRFEVNAKGLRCLYCDGFIIQDVTRHFM